MALVVVAALLAPAQASAEPVEPAGRSSAGAGSECPWCLPPNAPPPKCIPAGQYDSPYYWEYLSTRSWTNPNGHGWRVHEYYISAEWSMLSRKVTCKINF
ncbi:MAG TPA: hypothetical protein VK020_15170 [Microlunatus sp.]|nr:hypothetical protein [Microlunatus sp.]